MRQQKWLFLDRDGTLIQEPADKQIDCFKKLALMPDVIPALLKLKKAGYRFVLVSNQDGLGSAAFPLEKFTLIQTCMLQIFQTQGIEFADILICPHIPEANCACRKPKVGLVMPYLIQQNIDRARSYVIGDRITDMQLAANMGIQGLQIDPNKAFHWNEIANTILGQDRCAQMTRETNETKIQLAVNLDQPDQSQINTGIEFFNHMLAQLAKHGGFSLLLSATGDLAVDDHHLVEDCAIILGEALKQALGDKQGIQRFGYLLPMDESLAQVAIDLSGRGVFKLTAAFTREKVGDLATELVPHFFRSLAESLKASLHIEAKGENMHHLIECIFKAVGRALRQAVQKTDEGIPSTKGYL
jgi:imidazoleglycerol-phosphate dehydratase/histidinol-phosphatase